MQKLLSDLSAGVASLPEEAKQGARRGFNELGSRVSTLEEQQCKQAKLNEEYKGEVYEVNARAASLENQMRVAAQSATAREDLHDYRVDRPPNFEIIKVGAYRCVTKRAVQDALALWLQECDIALHIVTLEGRGPGETRFLANLLSASGMVQEALEFLRD